MKYTKYSPLGIREIEPNVCSSGVCDLESRKECEKESLCLKQMSFSEEVGLTRISPYKDLDEKDRYKIDRAVKKWRKEMFKKCKKIIYIIKHEQEGKQ